MPLDEVADVWHGVTSAFRDYGYRRLRTRARLKFLVADWGVEKFREVLEDKYLKRKLIDGPAPEVPAVQEIQKAALRKRESEPHHGRGQFHRGLKSPGAESGDHGKARATRRLNQRQASAWAAPNGREPAPAAAAAMPL